MIVKYDDEEITLTERYIDALNEVLAAEVEMMRAAWEEEGYADCWYWGRATIGDLSSTRAVEFQFGAEEDMPDDGLGRFAVLAD